VYLDQNIVGYFYDGLLSVPERNDIQWVYSSEHFSEIARGNATEFLSVFEKLKARQIYLVHDNDFKITGNVRLHEYLSPYELYERHIETINQVPFDQSPMLELLARMYGANNFESACSVPDKLDEQIRLILEGLPIENVILSKWEKARADLTKTINEHLVNGRTLEEMRAPIGLSKGRASNLQERENPIVELWQLVGAKAAGITCDQLFGFDPIDKQGYKTWPLYLGIVGCHAILNAFGYRPDKNLSVPAALAGVVSDGSHIGYGAFCNAVISEDSRFCSKASAIYRYKNIATKVIRLIRDQLG